MPETSPSIKSANGRAKRLLILAASGLLLAIAAFYILLRLTIALPFTADKISGFLSKKAGCRVSISGARISGATLTLEGLALWNPQGFTRHELVSVRAISLSPDWLRLLTGTTGLARLEFGGVVIRLEKNQNGRWNFWELITSLVKKKRQPTGDITIARLTVDDLSLIVNGRRSASMGMKIRNFSTKGSTESGLAVSAEDPSGNPIQLTAQGKMGQDPSFRLVLDSPRLSLASMQLSGKRKLPAALANATAGIRLTSELRGSLASARFDGSLAGISLPAGGNASPLQGTLHVSLRYDTVKDEAGIDTGTLSLSDSPPIRFSGSVSRVRRDALFELRVSRHSMPLGSLAFLLPESLRTATALGGTLSTSGLTIRGSRKTGITSGRMDLAVRNASASGRGRVLLDNGSMDMTMTGGRDGWVLDGRFASAPGTAPAIIQAIQVPFTARFSPRMKPLSVAVPAVTAHVFGTALKGEASYRQGAPTPWNGVMTATVADIAVLNKHLAKTSLQFVTGSGSLTAKATGSSLQQYEAHARASADSLSFTFSGRTISLGNAAVTSRLLSNGSGFSADGSLRVGTAIVDGRHWDMSTDYSLGNKRLELRNAELRGSGTSFRLAEAAVLLPTMQKKEKAAGIPLRGTIKGLDLVHGSVSAPGISGSINCRYYTAGSSRRLIGSTDAAIPSLTVQDRKAGSLTARLVFSGQDATATLQGTSLGGPVAGTIQAKPFAGDKSLSFLVRFREQRLAELSGLAPSRQSVLLSGGLLDATLEGSMNGKSGLHAQLTATGRDISLKNAGGREITSGLKLELHTIVNGEDFTLQDAVISRSPDMSARLSGWVKRFATADRKGNVSCSVDTVRLNSILDAFANVLPRALQEAEGQGTLAMRGDISLDGKNFGTDGELTITGASLEIPSQKIAVADIEGRLPFSFVFPGQGHGRQSAPVSYSKDNYQRLLMAFRSAEAKGTPLRIGSIRFGALQTGKAEAFVNAARGTMEINPLNVALYGGSLVGKGFLGYDNGLEFKADLLLNNLSLQQFCAAFQKIEGYMTGRVDGVMSLYQGNNKVRGLNGFVNLWTRTGNGEKMLVSKEFLQKLSGKKLRGFLFTNDRRYDNGEISAFLRDGFLTFEKLDISHRNILGMKDLSVTVVPVQNRISLDHLLESIREAATRGKGGDDDETKAPVQTDIKWLD